MQDGNVHLTIRLPQREHAQIQRAAEDSCRSLQKEILWRLRQTLTSQPAPAA